MRTKVPQMEEHFRCAHNPEDTLEINTYNHLYDGTPVIAIEWEMERHPEDEPSNVIALTYEDVTRLHAMLTRIVEWYSLRNYNSQQKETVHGSDP